MFSDEPSDRPPSDADTPQREAPRVWRPENEGTFREGNREDPEAGQKRWDAISAEGAHVDRMRAAISVAEKGPFGQHWSALRKLSNRVIQSWMGVLSMEFEAKSFGQPKGDDTVHRLYGRLRLDANMWMDNIIYATRVENEFGLIGMAGYKWILSCFKLASYLDRGANAAYMAGVLSWNSGLNVARGRVQLQAAQAELATLAMTLSNMNRLILSEREEETTDKEVGNAARLRRLRARRRQGMIGRVSVSLYRQDVALLRKLGLLPSGETTREQQEEALEVFLTFSTLTRHDPGLSWKDRVESQSVRLSTLGIADEDEKMDPLD